MCMHAHIHTYIHTHDHENPYTYTHIHSTYIIYTTHIVTDTWFTHIHMFTNTAHTCTHMGGGT